MHIPDGYLSPSTCATLYGAATPFWYFSLRRIKNSLSSQTVPLLSLFAAFSFVVMMFNLPLPGGTTGHAVGMGMAAIVLGPWVSIAAISLALLVQALLFGDGGITAFGANCFNMAIVGSLASFAAYRMIARGADLTARRRVIAAGLAGYAGINLAALCAAIEFGLQPSLFHNAAGTPLYAPYPLSVSIPAMMIGHLTFAGLAELVLSAGMVAFIQRTDPELLRTTATKKSKLGLLENAQLGDMLPAVSRKLWLALGLILVLTPLGILAAGSAWGEWRARDYNDPAVRKQIERASGNQVAPQSAPTGLQKLSQVWKAPLYNYAPGFIRNVYLGYFVSASIGVGLLILLAQLWSAVAPKAGRKSSLRRISFVEKTVRRLGRAREEALFAEESARKTGLLQRIDVRAKMVGLGSLIIAAIAVQHVATLLAVLVFTCGLAIGSRISLGLLASRVWIGVLFFTGAISIPALFLVPGDVLARGTLLPWTITSQGLQSASLLVLRAECAATLVFLLTVTSYWSHVLRALRWFRVPAFVVVLLETSYRYVFVLLQTAQDMFESRQARLMGRMEPSAQRRFASSTAAVLFDKTLQLGSEVHCAMQARGFRGDIVLLEDLSMSASNWLSAASLVAASGLIVWLGR